MILFITILIVAILGIYILLRPVAKNIEEEMFPEERGG
jgi:hypothetical protein